MLAATSQVCPKGLVAFETLKAVHSKIVGLPVKEKKFFKTKEAVDYLFQDIHDAIVNKNYTIEDISEYFVSAGWLISQTSLNSSGGSSESAWKVITIQIFLLLKRSSVNIQKSVQKRAKIYLRAELKLL